MAKLRTSAHLSVLKLGDNVDLPFPLKSVWVNIAPFSSEDEHHFVHLP